MSSKDVSDIGKDFQNKNKGKIVELHIKHKGLDHDQIKFISHSSVKDAVAHLKKSGSTPLMINDSRLTFVYPVNGGDQEYLTHIFYDRNKFDEIKSALKNGNGVGTGVGTGKGVNMQEDYFGSVYNNIFGRGSPSRGGKLPQLPIEDRIPPTSSIKGPLKATLTPGPVERFPVGAEAGPGCGIRKTQLTPRSLAMTPLSQLGKMQSGLYQSEFDRGCGCGDGAKSNGNGNQGPKMSRLYSSEFERGCGCGGGAGPGPIRTTRNAAARASRMGQ